MFKIVILLCLGFPLWGQMYPFPGPGRVIPGGGGGGSSISVLQSCINHNNNSNDVVCTFGSATTANSTVACTIGLYNDSAGSGTLIDNNSNTYTFDTNSGSALHGNNGWWYTAGISGRASHAITFTKTGDSPSIICFELSNAGALDQKDGAAGGTSNLTVAAVTPTEDNEIVLSSIASLGGSGWTASGFGNYQEYVYTSGESFGISAGYVIQSTAGARNAAWVAGASFSALNLAARTITFKQSSGALSFTSLSDAAFTALSNAAFAALTN